MCFLFTLIMSKFLSSVSLAIFRELVFYQIKSTSSIRTFSNGLIECLQALYILDKCVTHACTANLDLAESLLKLGFNANLCLNICNAIGLPLATTFANLQICKFFLKTFSSLNHLRKELSHNSTIKYNARTYHNMEKAQKTCLILNGARIQVQKQFYSTIQ